MSKTFAESPRDGMHGNSKIQGNSILTPSSKKDLQIVMTKIPCPKCNSRAYDDNSFFCYKCGTQLSAITPERLPGLEKKKTQSLSYKTLLPEKKTTFVREDSLQSQKPAPVQPVRPEHPGDTLLKPPSVPFQHIRPESGEDSALKPPSASVHHIGPIEICAHCGVPVLHKNRVFCENCGVNIREELVGDVSILKHPVLEHRVKTPVVRQDTETRILKEQEPVLFQGTGIQVHPKLRKVIIILSGIAIIIIMLVLIFMFIVSFWASLY